MRKYAAALIAAVSVSTPALASQYQTSHAPSHSNGGSNVSVLSNNYYASPTAVVGGATQAAVGTTVQALNQVSASALNNGSAAVNTGSVALVAPITALNGSVNALNGSLSATTGNLAVTTGSVAAAVSPTLNTTIAPVVSTQGLGNAAGAVGAVGSATVGGTLGLLQNLNVNVLSGNRPASGKKY